MTLEAVFRGCGEWQPQRVHQGVGEAGGGGCEVPTQPPYQEEEYEAAGTCQQGSAKFSLCNSMHKYHVPDLPEEFSHVLFM